MSEKSAEVFFREFSKTSKNWKTKTTGKEQPGWGNYSNTDDSYFKKSL